MPGCPGASGRCQRPARPPWFKGMVTFCYHRVACAGAVQLAKGQALRRSRYGRSRGFPGAEGRNLPASEAKARPPRPTNLWAK